MASNATVADDERIPTNLRTLLILEVLATSEGPITPTEIGRRVGLPKPTIHRLCASLVEEGFLARDLGGKKMRAGKRARDLANGLLHNGVDATLRRQILNRVATAVQETVNFAAPVADGMTYVDRVETDWAFRIQLPIGALVPFHCTASGKTFLASLPPAKRRRMVEALELDARTRHSHTDPAALLEELELTARRGYALDREELMEGMVALAVPVRDKSGRYVAAIAFHGPTPRLSIDIARRHLPTLEAASKDLTALLFG